MANIGGIFNSLSDIDNGESVVERLRTVHAVSNVGFTHRVMISNDCVILNSLTGLLNDSLDQPVVDEAEDTFLLLEGEIFNKNELLKHIAVSREMSLCGILLELFLCKGIEFVSLLNGEFNVVIYCKTEGRLIILNDHLSSKPMYYMEVGGKLLFGSEKKSILALTEKSPRLDGVGLLQMFVHSHNLSGRSFIEGIKCLPPASILEYHRGRLSVRRYCFMRFNVPMGLRGAGYLAEKWGEELKQATMRRVRGKNGLLINLSGGCDSRAVACAIPRDYRPIWARTRGSKFSQELVYAAKIADRLGFYHYREEPTGVLLSDILPKIVWRTECAVNSFNCLSLANHASMKKHGDFLIGGILGGTVKGYNYLRLLQPCSQREFIDRTYRWYLKSTETCLSEVFTRDFLRKHSPSLKEAFLASFDPVEAETNKQLYETWDLYEYQARLQLATGAVDTYLFEHIRPFLDKEHLNFVLQLPTRLRFGQILYQTVIYELGPEIRDIPIANSNLRLRSSILNNNLNTIMTFSKKSLIKILGKMGISSVYAYKPAVMENPAQFVKSDLKLRRIIENFLQSDSFDHSIFNAQGILKILHDHYTGVGSYPLLICQLATFAVGIPYFVTRRPIRCPAEAEPLSN